MEALDLYKFKRYGLNITPYLKIGKRIQINNQVWRIIGKTEESIRLVQLNVERETLKEDELEVKDIFQMLK